MPTPAQALKKALDEGLSSGIHRDVLFTRVRYHLQLTWTPPLPVTPPWYTARAKDDLVSLLHRRIHQLGRQEAERYLLGLEQALSDESTTRTRQDRSRELRRLQYGSHTLFYRQMPVHRLLVRVLDRTL